MITTGDLLAATDLMTDIVNDADEADLDTAIALMEALEGLKSEMGRAKAALETKVREQLEDLKQPRQVGDRLYLMKDGKAKPLHDHLMIVRAVAHDAAMPDENGEIPTPRAAALRAAKTVYELYVAPRDKPKVTEMKKHFDAEFLKDVVTWEPAGRELEVIDLRED
jgi:hypothetical protein